MRSTPTQSADHQRIRETIPQLVHELREEANKMQPGPDRIRIFQASNWLVSLSERVLRGMEKEADNED